jgi:hypothetical protein
LGANLIYSSMQVCTSIRRIPSITAINLGLVSFCQCNRWGWPRLPTYPPVDVPAIKSKISHGSRCSSPCKPFSSSKFFMMLLRR